MDLWLSVIDYAVVKKVSISTLRRRIKSQSLETKIDHGRYLIRIPQSEVDTFEKNMQFEPLQNRSEDRKSDTNPALSASIQDLIQELKSAYSQILSEKETMITQLKSEVEILKHINLFLEQQIMNSPQPSLPTKDQYLDPDLI